VPVVVPEVPEVPEVPAPDVVVPVPVDVELVPDVVVLVPVVVVLVDSDTLSTISPVYVPGFAFVGTVISGVSVIEVMASEFVKSSSLVLERDFAPTADFSVIALGGIVLPPPVERPVSLAAMLHGPFGAETFTTTAFSAIAAPAAVGGKTKPEPPPVKLVETTNELFPPGTVIATGRVVAAAAAPDHARSPVMNATDSGIK